MATNKKTFSERLQESYENLGESGQRTLYAQNGAGTYGKRPHINPLSGANEKHSPAFSLMRPHGNIRVRWYDFKEGRGGDLYDFLKETRGESYARSVLGLDDYDVVPIHPKKRVPEPPPVPHKSHTFEQAKKFYRRSTEPDQRVKDYLESRSITVPLPPSIRSDGNTMLSIVSGIGTNFKAVHITSLWKAPDEKRKKRMYGPAGEGSVHLGEPTDGKLALTEGIEDGLSVLQATGIPTWATLSTSNLKKLLLPDNIKEIYIFADSDQIKHGNPDHITSFAGQRAAQELEARLIEEGRTVKIIYPTDQTDAPEKKDFNDLLVEDPTGQLIRDRFDEATTLPSPEYPEIGSHVDEAAAPLREAISNFFDRVLYTVNNTDENPDVYQDGIQIDMAGGKTQEAIQHVAQVVNDGLRGVIAVPQHRLSRDIMMRLSALTDPSNVNVWLGYEQPDPLASDKTMCRYPETVTNIIKALGKVEDFCGSQTPCEFRPDKDGKSACGEVCGYWRQKLDQTTKVWIVPANMLARHKPSNIGAPNFLVIDEDFHHFMLRGTDGRNFITRADLLEPRTFPPQKNIPPVMVEAYTDAALKTVQTYLDGLEHGYFPKSELLSGPFREAAQHMISLEWLLKKEIPKDIREMHHTKQKEVLESIAAYNNAVSKRSRFWQLMVNLIDGTEDETPYLNWNGLNVGLSWKETIHTDWGSAPTLYMDGTLNEQITKNWLPDLEVRAKIRIEATHVHRVQVIDMPFAQSAFVPNIKSRDHKTQCNNAKRFDRFVEIVAAQNKGKGAGDYDVLVVAQKGLVEYLLEEHKKNPTWDISRVGWEWQNNLRGIDKYKGVSAEIVANRILPTPKAIEFTASVITGRVVPPIEGNWYPKREKLIRMADGSTVPVMGEYHPDPDAEAVRWQTCEGELIQAEARARGNRRTAENPLTVYICTNVCLPLTIHETMTYREWVSIGTGVRLMAARDLVPDDLKGMAAVLKGGPVQQPKRELDSTFIWFKRNPEERARLDEFRESLNARHTASIAIREECRTFGSQDMAIDIVPPYTEKSFKFEDVSWCRIKYRLPDTRKSTQAWIRTDVDHAALLQKFFGPGVIILLTGEPVAVVHHGTRLVVSGLGQPGQVPPDQEHGPLQDTEFLEDFDERVGILMDNGMSEADAEHMARQFLMAKTV